MQQQSVYKRSNLQWCRQFVHLRLCSRIHWRILWDRWVLHRTDNVGLLHCLLFWSILYSCLNSVTGDRNPVAYGISFHIYSLNWFWDISNWIADICNSIGDILIQINSVNKCENGARRFHMYSLNCRYLQLNWRYLQLNWRYLQILPIWRYLQLNCRYLQLNWRYLQIGVFGDISNSIADKIMFSSIGDICNSVNKCENGAP